MFATPVLAVANRLIAGETWARDTLRAHVGKVANVSAAGFSIRFRVADHGDLASDAGDLPPDVNIEIPAHAVTHLFDGVESLSRHARISGDAHFAEAIALLLRHLRPDLGAALSPFLGNILAHRIERGLSVAGQTARATAQNFGANVLEYVTEEKEWVVKRTESEGFASELARLRDDLGRLEKRLERLF